jgi:agmatinase
MQPIDPNAAAAGEGIYGLPHMPEDSAVVLLPVPFDATTSYRPGTANGPGAILAASRQVELFDEETGNPWSRGIAMLPQDPRIAQLNHEARPLAEQVMEEAPGSDAARLRVDAIGEQVNTFVRETAASWLDAGRIVGTVGGDHSVPFGAIAAHAARYPGMGILHVDAHADLRHAYSGFAWSHASIMDNVIRRIPEVPLVQLGIRDYCEEELDAIRGSGGRIRTFFDRELHVQRLRGASFGEQVERIVACLPPDVYVSFDVDGLDPKLCPNTGTPVPGGLDFNEACYLLAALVESGRRIVGFDLVEVAPGPDEDEWDANVGARLLYKLIGWALRSRAHL